MEPSARGTPPRSTPTAPSPAKNRTVPGCSTTTPTWACPGYYDPALGQFLSPDALVPDAGVLFDYNRYMYTEEIRSSIRILVGTIVMRRSMITLDVPKTIGIGRASRVISWMASGTVATLRATMKAFGPDSTAVNVIDVTISASTTTAGYYGHAYIGPFLSVGQWIYDEYISSAMR
jgi:hypothetical protein